MLQGATKHLTAGMVVTLLSSSYAFACTATFLPFNAPMKTRADCSFENADSEPGRWGRDTLSGGKAMDRGNGRVAQKIVVSGGCSHHEYLVFSDCEAGEAIAIGGSGSPEYNPDEDATIAGFIGDSIEYIQPPFGPIRANGRDTVAGLLKQAEAKGYDRIVRGAANDDLGYWTKYKSNCGCKLFYPGTKGAQGKLN